MELFTNASGVVYKFIAEEEARLLAGLTREQKMVYSAIKQGGNSGIWVREIRLISNLPGAEISKILQSLMVKKLIKTEMNHQTKKKVYMLYDVAPSTEITGGTWFSGADLDVEFVTGLYKICMQFLQSRDSATLSEVTSFIQQSGISKIELLQKDIQSLLNVMMYDGAVEIAPQIANSRSILSTETRYRKTPATISEEQDPYTTIPCSVCPVIGDCGEGNLVSPSTCEYFKQWLEF